MKVGILTFFCAHNYGAVLQCFGLQQAINELGYDVEVINYKPEYLIKPYLPFTWRSYIRKNIPVAIKNLVLEPITYKDRVSRYNKFEQFIHNKLNLSKGEDWSLYDFYVMGSDQIWNKKITKGFDKIYWGYLPFQKGNKKYLSYAASMEASHITPEDSKFYQKSLKNFDAISVREDKLQSLLQPICDKDIQLVLDPTLIIDRKHWDKIAIKPDINKKYILLYQVAVTKEIYKMAEKIAKQLDAEIIEIASYKSWKKSNAKILYNTSPEEFVGWFKYASFILTTSFHGTAFSVIFNKPFYTLDLNNNKGTRAMSLLSLLGLTDRIINHKERPSFKELDYTNANHILEKEKEKSISFLSKNLSNLNR